MKSRKTALTLACTAVIASTAGVALAQTSDNASADTRRHLSQLTQSRQQQQREMSQMNQTMKRAQTDVAQLRHDMSNQVRNSALSMPPIKPMPTIKQLDLQRAGFAGFRGAVKLQPLPELSVAGRPPVGARAVHAKAATEIMNLPVGSLADSAAPGAGTALSVVRLFSSFRSAYEVGTGRASPSQLNSIVPHVVLACNRLGTPIDFNGMQNLEWATPIGFSGPGLSHNITGHSLSIQTRRDPMTDALITTSRTHTTSRSRMNGAQFNAFWNRYQNNLKMTRPPTIRPMPRIQPMFRFQPMLRIQPMPRIQTYSPPIRTFSPPPRHNF